ncbi:YiiX family permuted papain-like enzyme [Chryseosolibacter indicus]|uniref:YiiX family permuted papain-like enzyme n=1 Tax=Chryseosolibacter indicus TaxID=2782351 RepID=A0ABS5VPE4_9BACT|nr:YiiX family permuted papain-like enzyme [Chryseosolibacter indicus]MBT1703206.1 YiiX family permuted papain-like enzyme [Chryseosolibacter indicus]
MKKIIITILFGIIGGVGILVLDIRRSKEEKSTGLLNGDIIFQTSKSDQSKAIQLATNSKYSHMGIIYKQEEDYFVYEAVQPVKLTALDEWIKRGERNHYVVKRLKNREQLLTSESLKRLKDVGEKFIGKNYDVYFEWSDNNIYCSELVWKIYKEALRIELGQLQELRSFDLTHDLVRKKLKERYGDNIPLAEKVISPVGIFNAAELVTVEEK